MSARNVVKSGVIIRPRHIVAYIATQLFYPKQIRERGWLSFSSPAYFVLILCGLLRLAFDEWKLCYNYIMGMFYFYIIRKGAIY